MPKKWLLTVYPYLICILGGIALLIGAYYSEDYAADLLVNMAAAFFVIPALFVLYESTKKASERSLNRELLEYAKLLIDSEVLSMISQLMKSVYSYDECALNEKNVRSFLKKNFNEIKNTLEVSEYLGFQVLKDWSDSITKTKRILENPFIMQKIGNKQAIIIVQMLKGLTNIELIHKRLPDMYVIGEKEVEGYKLQGETEINPKNEYPDRYMLLQYLEGDKFVVKDFGDFPRYQLPNLLKMCKIKEDYIELYGESVSYLINAIERWLACTGYEIIVDPMRFKNALVK